MADIAVSATETALENQRIGALQIRVVALCTAIQMCDGYDIGAIGWAVPPLTHAWNMPGPAFTFAFALSNVGILVGALVAGPSATGSGAARCCWSAPRCSASPRCSPPSPACRSWPCCAFLPGSGSPAPSPAPWP